MQAIKKQIRRDKKSLRRNLSYKEQSNAARLLAKHARSYAPLFRANRLLSYLPFAGEINPLEVERLITAHLYFPKITLYREGKMQFYCANSERRINALGINEPTGSHPPLAARHFDVALVPLVAFQRDGSRLGMGAGFYDRAFSFRNQSTHTKRPLLVGLAHHFQEAEELVSQTWDVGLDAIITDRELIVP